MNTSTPVKLLHISDLHFGTHFRSEQWEILKSYVRNSVKPDAILVTGDIVDSPDRKVYQHACDSIHALGSPWFVCPGNHDRFHSGNLGLSLWEGKEWALFYKVFKNNLPTLQNPARLPLGPVGNKWNVTIMGIESCESTDAFARGYISNETIEALKGSIPKNDKADLRILLLHHHLLQIPSLESHRIGKISDLGNWTALVNSGTALEAMAKGGNINIALHGHEHVEHLAKYATLSEGGGETVIIASGSATGMRTLKGWATEGMRLSVLELRQDRSVILHRVSYSGGWQTDKGTVVLNDSEVRRASFLRATGSISSVPRTEIIKHIELSPEGAGYVREHWINYDLRGKDCWLHPIRSSSGFPHCQELAITNLNGEVWHAKTNSTQPDVLLEDGEDVYGKIFKCSIPISHQTVDARIELSYLWISGAILTKQQLNDAKELRQADEIRRRGFEYAAILVPEPVASITLAVRFPPALGPIEAEMKTWIQDQQNHEVEELGQNQRSFFKLNDGLYTMGVTHPLVGKRYIIAWKPRDPQAVFGSISFIRKCRTDGDRIASSFVRSVKGRMNALGLKGEITAALYHPEKPNSTTLLLGGKFPRKEKGLLESIMSNGHPLLRQGLGGTIGLLNRAEAELRGNEWKKEILGDEEYVLVFPIRFNLAFNDPRPWGIIRLGLQALDETLQTELKFQSISLLQPIILPALAALVSDFFKSSKEIFE